MTEALEPGRGLDTDGLRKAGLGLAVSADDCPGVMLERVVAEVPGLGITEGEPLNA